MTTFKAARHLPVYNFSLLNKNFYKYMTLKNNSICIIVRLFVHIRYVFISINIKKHKIAIQSLKKILFNKNAIVEKVINFCEFIDCAHHNMILVRNCSVYFSCFRFSYIKIVSNKLFCLVCLLRKNFLFLSSIFQIFRTIKKVCKKMLFVVIVGVRRL